MISQQSLRGEWTFITEYSLSKRIKNYVKYKNLKKLMETIQESLPYQTRPSSRKKLDFTTLLDMSKQSEFSEKDLNNQK